MSPLEQLAHSIIQDCADAIIAKTITGTLVSWNDAAEKMFGYSAREVLGHSVMLLVPPEHVIEERQILEGLGRGERIRDLHTMRLHKNGQAIAVTLTISPILDAAGNVIGACKIARPRIASSLSVKELTRLALRDALTGLSNRTHLLDRLNQAMCRNERGRKHGGLLFIDLDNFKAVNDTAGHQSGDKLLIKCARRMEGIFRECDTIARWGGDEFLVLVEDLPPDQPHALEYLEHISRKLLVALRKPYCMGQAEFRSPPSIGACLFRGVAHPVEAVIHQADRAMYSAKMSGKNAFCVDGAKPNDTLDAIPAHVAVA